MSLEAYINTATPGDTPGLARVRQARMDLILQDPLTGNLAAAYPLREIQTEGESLSFAFDGKTITFNQAFGAQPAETIQRQLSAVIKYAVADGTIPEAMVIALKQALKGYSVTAF